MANSAKPIHVDDTFFLYWARTISPRPGEQPIKNINWLRFDEPLLEQTKHYAPGWAILLSVGRKALGENPSRLHWLQWPFATMFLIGVFLLAHSLRAPPWPTLLVCATSPAFLLPSASLMADMPGMGLALLGLGLWNVSPSLRIKVVAVLLLALGGQMKQTVLVMFPLLLLEPDGRIRRNPAMWGLAIVGFALAGYYPDVAPHDPERRSIISHFQWIVGSTWNPLLVRPKLSYALATLSALMLAPLAYFWSFLARNEFPAVAKKANSAFVGLACIPVLSVMGFWKGYKNPDLTIPQVPGTWNSLWFYLSIAIFIAWAVLAFWSGRKGRFAWLYYWLALSVVGFALGTFFPAVRFLMPALPPMAMIFLIDLERNCSNFSARIGIVLATVGNLLLGTSLAFNDYTFAEFSKTTANRGAARAAAMNLPLVTTGSWGLRYYVEQEGGGIIGHMAESLRGGAIVLDPELTDHRILPDQLRKRSRLVETAEFTGSRMRYLLFPARTVPPARSAGAFHGGHVWFPYALSRVPFERIHLLEIGRL